MNRRMSAALIGLAFCVTVLGVQDSPRIAPSTVPDLTGTWVLNLPKSDVGSDRSRLYDELTLTILHREPEIKIVRNLTKKKKTTSQRLVYYTNKRGESNPTIVGGRLDSKTSWEGNALVSTGVTRREVALNPFIVTETIERWEISPDGTTLKQIISIKTTLDVYRNGHDVSSDTRTFVRVFERKTEMRQGAT